jgi:hypothetical protein
VGAKDAASISEVTIPSDDLPAGGDVPRSAQYTWPDPDGFVDDLSAEDPRIARAPTVEVQMVTDEDIARWEAVAEAGLVEEGDVDAAFNDLMARLLSADLLDEGTKGS